MEEGKKTLEFNGDGTVTITKAYTVRITDFIIDELPNTCYGCPCGFMANDEGVSCGRRIPLDRDCRSPDCKLKTIEQVLEERRNQS